MHKCQTELTVWEKSARELGSELVDKKMREIKKKIIEDIMLFEHKSRAISLSAKSQSRILKKMTI